MTPEELKAMLAEHLAITVVTGSGEYSDGSGFYGTLKVELRWDREVISWTEGDIHS